MLSQDVERYITLQRTLGYKFGDQSCSLKLFAAYAMVHGDEFIRVERVLACPLGYFTTRFARVFMRG